jgi:hypothetical protein
MGSGQIINATRESVPATAFSDKYNARSPVRTRAVERSKDLFLSERV